jgi:hypothetical protein
MQGKGVAQDTVEAARLWRLAAAQGNATALCNLGNLYALGEGVAQDFKEAATVSAGRSSGRYQGGRIALKVAVRARVRLHVLHELRRDAQAQDVLQVQGGALLRRGMLTAGVAGAQAALQGLGGGSGRGA